MSIYWTMLVATVVAFVLALIIQSVVQRQILATMALARASGDAALKQYYEELALKFVQNVGSEPDPNNADAFLNRVESRQDGFISETIITVAKIAVRSA